MAMDETMCAYFVIYTLLCVILQSGFCLHRGEYCIDETFTASCSDNEIIKITNATYGRMQVGKCISNAVLMGCKEDVRHKLDRKCSGRHKCSFGVFDGLRDIKPCPKGTGPYLEVIYDCIGASTLGEYACPNKPIVLTTKTYHISPTQLHCTLPHWSIRVQPGQRLDITLTDFTRNEHRTICSVLGYIIESVVRTNKTLCASDIREQHLYTSVGYHVDVHLIPESEREATGIFVLEYKVIGCPDIDVPPFVYYTRDDKEVNAGCSADEFSWHTECVQGQWSATIGNCSSSSVSGNHASRSVMQFLKDIPEYILISVVIGVAVLLSIIVLICGVVYISRHRQHDNTYSETYSQGPRRSDSEFKLYGGPTMGTPVQTIRNERPEYYNDGRLERNTQLLDHRSVSVHSTPIRTVQRGTVKCDPDSGRPMYNTFQDNSSQHTRQDDMKMSIYTGLQNVPNEKDTTSGHANATDDNKIVASRQNSEIKDEMSVEDIVAKEDIYLEPEHLDNSVHNMDTLQIAYSI